MDLDIGAAIVEGCLIGESLGRRHMKSCIGFSRIQRTGRIIKLRSGNSGTNGHVGTDMLERLKPADRATKLLAQLGIVRGHIAGGIGAADGEGGSQ